MKAKKPLKKSAAPVLLDFSRVTVLRGEKVALKNITMKIRVGENVAIIGANGSGKSTLIKSITRECYPWDGTLKIFGKEKWDVFKLRDQLGIVTQDLQQAVAQNVAGRNIPGAEVILSGFFSSVGVWSKEKVTRSMERKVEQVLHFLEISHLKDRPLSEMSSGEARRILIGRALVHDPQALVLDEPTNSLDFKAVEKFRNSLRKIAKSGKSILLVTHNLGDLIPEIRRVILLKEGEIFKDGPVETTLTPKNLDRIF